MGRQEREDKAWKKLQKAREKEERKNAERKARLEGTKRRAGEEKGRWRITD